MENKAMEEETRLDITDHEASQIKGTFAITLPPSQQAHQKNIFKNKFWQGKPSPPRKGIAAMMGAVGMLRDIAIRQAGQDDIQRYIVEVLKGDEDKEKRQKVVEYFRDNWSTINKDQNLKYRRPETILKMKSESGKSPESKSLSIVFSPVHLAIIYNSEEVLENVFEHMDEDPDYFEFIANLKLGTNLTLEDLDEFTNIPDEACALSSIFLCVKYNIKALERILVIAKKHKLFDKLIESQELRGMNLLHFSTLNKTLECIQLLCSSSGEDQPTKRSLLFNSRNRFGESVLHTARTTEMIDFLLECEEKDPCTEELSKMIYSRDSRGHNVLSSYISRDLDLAQHFLSHHISTNGHNSNSEKFMLCLDVSPIIAQKTEKFKEVDESSVIGCLEPLTKNKRGVLLHPVINTFIMMKYNSYAGFFFLILMFKLLYAISLSGLALIAINPGGENRTDYVDEDGNYNCHKNPYFWLWLPFAATMTILMLLKEIGEMINLKSKWIVSHNFVQLFLIFTTFAFLVLVTMPLKWWMNYLAAWTVMAGWMDITMALRSLMFGKLSSLGLYILMLKEVSKKVFMFFGIYITTILGFALVFILLIYGEQFENEEKSFVKVVAMMIGEVEYGDTFADKNIAINLVFLFFVFIVPIIINNLLIGLTVSNVSELILNANVKSLESKIRTIAQFEKSFVMTRIFKNLSSISNNSCQEVCIQPSNRRKSILSEVDLTVVHKVSRDDKDQRVMGERLTFLWWFITYVPISVYEESIRRINIDE